MSSRTQSTKESVGVCNEEERNTVVMIRLVMSLYVEAETRIGVNSEL